ncbi:hypothetical protein E4U11_000799 [Claviceps purpurea]|nr:hypothetical protein E4U11_000799 [Claviceps purpurea]
MAWNIATPVSSSSAGENHTMPAADITDDDDEHDKYDDDDDDDDFSSWIERTRRYTERNRNLVQGSRLHFAHRRRAIREGKEKKNPSFSTDFLIPCHPPLGRQLDLVNNRTVKRGRERRRKHNKG